MTFKDLFGGCRPVIGMVHLLPLPGSHRYQGDLAAVRRRALDDVRSLAAGGCDAVLVENYHDAPFHKDRVGPETIAAMTWITTAVVEAVMVPVGVNILRNDAIGAVAVATVAEARFVRVNVHVGVTVTDQGLIEGRAAETLRFRGALGSDVAIFADVHVKHGNPLGGADVIQAAHDVYYRGLANALIVTGGATGAPCDLDQARLVRKNLADAPLLVGSGVDLGNIGAVMEIADGVIVGTAFHTGHALDQPIDQERVAKLVDVAKRCP